MNSVHVTFIERKHWKTLDSVGKGSSGEVFLAKKKYSFTTPQWEASVFRVKKVRVAVGYNPRG